LRAEHADGFEIRLKQLPAPPRATFIAHSTHADPATIVRIRTACFHLYVQETSSFETFEAILTRLHKRDT